MARPWALASRATARRSMWGWARNCFERPSSMSRAAGFTRISVIAATGTRAYYAARGFTEGELYMNGPL